MKRHGPLAALAKEPVGAQPFGEALREGTDEEERFAQPVTGHGLAVRVARHPRDGERFLVPRERVRVSPAAEGESSRRVEDPREELVRSRRPGAVERLTEHPLPLIEPVLEPENVSEGGHGPSLESLVPDRSRQLEGALVVPLRLGERSQLLPRLAPRQGCLGGNAHHVGSGPLGGLESPVVPPDRLIRCEHSSASMPGERGVPSRTTGIVGMLGMMRQDLGELFGALTGDLLQPAEHSCVRLALPDGLDRRVCRIARQYVVEDELPFPLDRRPWTLVNEPSIDEHREGRVNVSAARKLRDRPVPEAPPHDRRVLKHAALVRVEQLDARGDHLVHRGRQLVGERSLERPAVLSPYEGARLDHHPEQLLSEERIPFGPREQRPESIPRRRQPFEKVPEQELRLLGREGCEGDRRGGGRPAAPGRPPLRQLGAGGAQERQRSLDGERQLGHHVEDGIVSPVNVFDDREDRLPRRERFEVRAPRPSDEPAGCVRLRAGKGVHAHCHADRGDEDP